MGNTPITEFCINYDVSGGQDIIECFEGELLPGEEIALEFGPITGDGLGGVMIRLETLNGEETDITWFQPVACYQDAVAICIYGCTDDTANNYNPDAEWDDGGCTYDVFGCTDESATNYNLLATVDDGSCIEPCNGYYFAPNTFTPNNDGWNDGWSIISDPNCWKQWNVRIYNRWGSCVWESTVPGEIWVGSVFNGDHYVSDGVYIYTMKGVGWNPSYTFEKTGHITIFR